MMLGDNVEWKPEPKYVIGCDAGGVGGSFETIWTVIDGRITRVETSDNPKPSTGSIWKEVTK